MRLRVFLFCLRKFLFRLRVFSNFIADVHPNLHILSKNEVPEDVTQVFLKPLIMMVCQLKNKNNKLAQSKNCVYLHQILVLVSSLLEVMSEKGIR